ncbi:MAG: hypothetical protein RL681_368 [Candidatus Parcubacteria bacterium]|jgi:uncharacterized protein YggU (UPF0235/DUF167 family)
MRLLVSVKPRAKRTAVEKVTDGVYDVSVTAAPEGGKANAAVIAALADYFRIARSRVTVVMGKTLRDKVITIDE